MKFPPVFALSLVAWLAAPAAGQPAAPSYPRPLRELTGYFPFQHDGPAIPEQWPQRREAVRNRVLLAAGLLPLPTRTPLNAVIHGRIERDDYTVDRVFFESFPGHYVCGNLYLPKNPPKSGRMPGILCPHGHWPKGRFMDLGADSTVAKEQLAIGAERFESGARSPLQARCVQLARMGCAVLFYDLLGNADSIQIADHHISRRPDLDGVEPGTFGLCSPMADLRLQTEFGLQTWNSIRALDFILTVPGVDPARLSCTGASGGGTQTFVLAAIDDRLATAFPCVMASTAMQGGCTCENAPYLRINQGNIDITANFAPKPMGLTAANDWTKELATKGFPDLMMVWAKLGKPDNLMATFNTHWQHNYNHVTRTTMYGFMNKHFNLGFPTPVLEREFVVSTPEELTVWTKEHPKPTGKQVGGLHEKALLKHWSEDSDRLIAGNKNIVGQAWEIIIGRAMPAAGDVTFEVSSEQDRADHILVKGTAHDRRHNETVPLAFLRPKAGNWNGNVALWLAGTGLEGLGDEAGTPNAMAKKLLNAGWAIICPTLYLQDATEQPKNPPQKSGDRFEWQRSACYTYGYNPTLVAHRVHDAMTVVAAIKHHLLPETPGKILIVGTDGAGAIAAAAAAQMKGIVDGAVIDTQGFRFASLNDQWHPLFVPGAVKYGDVPGLIEMCGPLKPVVLGENGVKGGTGMVAAAVLNWR